ncbi:hypothetical protein RGL50_005213 [Vibrio alginolyticus]|nr:hypothetical protein [Vibrio alginolyticus]
MNNLSSFKSKLLEISSSEHYLTKTCASYDSYVDELDDVINRLTPILSIGEVRKLIDKKLQLKTQRFNEPQYIQTACELAAMNDFLIREDIKLTYEKKVTPPKDVDFSLNHMGVTFNIEVKCPSFENKLDSEDGSVIISSLDRAPTKVESDEIVGDIQSRLKCSGVDSKIQKSMENNLRTFLASAQEKLIGADSKDINILIVCCDSALDMQAWRRYLFGFSGLFTENSFAHHSEFDRVDYVLLTNLYNRHHKFYEQTTIRDHWKLSSAFNLLYPNKFSNRNKLVVNGKDDFKRVSRVFTNYSEEFEEYLRDKLDTPNENESYEAKEFLGVTWFSDKYRDKGIYHFRESKGI